jgi:hypothetical protein
VLTGLGERIGAMEVHHRSLDVPIVPVRTSSARSVVGAAAGGRFSSIQESPAKPHASAPIGILRASEVCTNLPHSVLNY